MIDEELFSRLSEPAVCEDINVKYNYCPNCDTPMDLAGIEYQCRDCGLTKLNESDGNKDHDETVSGSIRITTGANRGRFYNVNGDYARTQKKMILDQLVSRQSKYSGPAFPMNILNATACQYNLIQKMIMEDEIDEDGKVSGQKKFVRRGNIKDEVLAGLIHFECIRENLVRKKKDIAEFMGLNTNGFARGEDILRNLEAEGKIDIPVDKEPIEGFVDRYLCALDLENAKYNQFIIDLVNESEAKKIGMNSQISSKIVGAIWILITKYKLGITSQALEKAADNTKKNTFTKFSKIILDNMNCFGHIFDRHGVPK